MDTDDHDHFKTIASQSAKPPTVSSTRQGAASSQSAHDQASCLIRAKAIFGCYRRDEAHDPDTFCAALAAILGDYSRAVVDYAADPRTGVINDFPMGLPNVGQIRGFLDATARRTEVLAQPARRAIPFVPPPLKPGEINSAMFAKLVEEGKTKSRPVGYFERVDDEWNRGSSFAANAAKIDFASIKEANERMFAREVMPGGTISKSLAATLRRED